MLTNEERREVAARLRVLADKNAVTATDFLISEIFKELGGEPPATPSLCTLGDLEAYDQAFLYRLADLIEPEPERTCRSIIAESENNEGLNVCSECGKLHFGTPFCAYCGAKVVSE